MPDLICGCEQGGDCTRTSVCQIGAALEDQQQKMEDLQAYIEGLESVIPIVRDFLWIAVCYNDHNFEVGSIQDKFRKTCEGLGVTSVESANAFLAGLTENPNAS